LRWRHRGGFDGFDSQRDSFAGDCRRRVGCRQGCRGRPHTRFAPGFVTSATLEEGARVVTFANGVVARELIVDVDVAPGGSRTPRSAVA
jgi:hypothetical protein